MKDFEKTLQKNSYKELRARQEKAKAK